MVCDPFGKRVRVARGKLCNFLLVLISLKEPETTLTGCFNKRTNYNPKIGVNHMWKYVEESINIVLDAF